MTTMFINIKPVIIAGILSFFACSCSENTNKVYKKIEQENTKLHFQLDSLASHLKSITNEQNPNQTSGNGSDVLSSYDIDFFRRKLLANPVEAIKADLVRNRQIIPAEGSLGGSMQFYKERIHILNRKWVMAYFEDGHTAGEILLEYNVSDEGNITWKVLSSRIL